MIPQSASDDNIVCTFYQPVMMETWTQLHIREKELQYSEVIKQLMYPSYQKYKQLIWTLYYVGIVDERHEIVKKIKKSKMNLQL